MAPGPRRPGEDALRPLPLGPGEPLSSYDRYPAARLQLVCGACAWSRSYDPARIIAGLRAKRQGDERTPPGEVARLVQWPCPRCRRMRWGARLAAPAAPPLA